MIKKTSQNNIPKDIKTNCDGIATGNPQIDNLKNGKKFTSETAKAAQKKSVEKRRENAIYKEVAEETLTKLLNKGALDDLTKDFADLSTKDQIAILEHLRDSSGQKPVEKLKITNPPTFIEDI